MTGTSKSSVRWRLASITISGFRGVAGDQTYSFAGRSGMLHGNNGMGKSTVAIALQWTLYGRFPDGVLRNNQLDGFLVPVGHKSKSYSGEVKFIRGNETAIMRRSPVAFSLMHGGETWEDEAAEVRRDALLGIDMETFVRAILLQQNRIRGLLLDEPKERNKAIDRLLGMDVLEHLLDVVKPKYFEDAAEEARESIIAEKQAFELKEKLLADQLQAVQQTARNLAFLNKDLNPTGLATRYAEVGAELIALATRSRVAIEPLSSCNGVEQVQSAKNVFATGIRTIRRESEPQKRAIPLDERIAKLSALRTQWVSALKVRDDARAAHTGLVEKHGERQSVTDALREATAKLEELQAGLKSANHLRQLLSDSHELVSATNLKDCPVCEQILPPGLDLPARLRERMAELASAEITGLEKALTDERQRCASIGQAVSAIDAVDKALVEAQKTVDSLRDKVVVETGGAGIAESKVTARIDESVERDEQEKKQLSSAIEALERELEALVQREDAIREGLVPVIQKRDEIAAHEVERKNLKARHAKAEAAAERMQRMASQVTAIRKAILDTKQESATELLAKAGPRASELYKRLVKQPVFNTLNVQTQAKAGKVDYVFSVRTGEKTATARDARLVLSDGQLTATALALFFGLAESASHDLDLLFVDDPTQNLDHPSKEAMAKVVSEVAQHRQVIVATQDEDFVAALKSEGFPDEAVIHHLKDWNGNPVVVSTGAV